MNWEKTASKTTQIWRETNPKQPQKHSCSAVAIELGAESTESELIRVLSVSGLVWVNSNELARVNQTGFWTAPWVGFVWVVDPTQIKQVRLERVLYAGLKINLQPT